MRSKVKIKRIVSLGLITFVLLISSCFFINKHFFKEKIDDNLINISYLSKEFVDNYLEESGNIKEEEKNNILIITSKEDIKETHGAINVIKAPNNQYILQYDSEEEKDKALKEFSNDESIVSAEENGFYTISETTYNSWGVEAMALDYAAELVNTKELNDVNVAIIDTGLDVELANKYYSGKIAETYNVLEESTTIMTDENGHGTHVFGTIAETTPSNVKILPIKVSENGRMYDTDIIAAINYVTYYEKADVINMSFGGYGYNQALEQAIEAAKEKNIISVAAAGNDNTSSNHYPAALDNTISIASVDSNLNKSTFSNYGSKIDFTAPGTDIKSIMSSEATISKNNGNTDGDNDHETISGTSMATPHAVSAVAILKSFNKNLTLDSTIELLQSRSIDLGVSGWDKYYGYGLISFENVEFCDETDCDEYNVFKSNNTNKMEVTKIEPKESGNYVIAYNYGNITNLMNQSIKIYYGDDLFIVKKLSDLDGVVIENYNPNIDYDDNTQEGIQEVTIKYAGCSTTINVMNYFLPEETIWEYEKIDDESIRIIGISSNVSVSNALPDVIYIPEIIDGYKVFEIGEGIFKGKTNLRKVFLPSTIEKIGQEAFANCSSLDTIDLPDGLKIIEDSAFKNTNLESVVFPESLLKIGESAFENSKIININIPKNVDEIGKRAFAGCNNVEQIVVDVNNNVYDSRDNSNAIIETATNTIIKGNHNTKISNTVEIIGASAFYNDNKIVKIIIPDSVKEIENFAFRYDENLIESKFREIIIPRSVTTIGTAVFNQNEKNITIYTYSDAFAKEYAINKKIAYKTIDYEDIYASLMNYKYKAFSKITGRLVIYAYYEVGYYSGDVYYSNELEIPKIFDGDVSELVSSNFEINYIDNRDSLRVGDEYAIIKGKDIYDNDFQSECMVEVSKATPEYTVPTNLQANLGQKLSEITLPSGFKWMNTDEVIEEKGTVIFKATYTPDDVENYEIVENIEISISVVNPREEIIPNIILKDKIYNGTTEISTDDITISNLNTSEYVVVSATSSSADVGDRTATIKLKLTDEKFENYSFDNGKQEKEFIIEFKIVPEKLKKPILKITEYIYSGIEQSIILDNYQEEKMNISGNTRTNVGEQDVVISLKNSNYTWEDDTSDDIVLKFKINKASSNIVYTSSSNSVKYDGNTYGINLNVESPSNAIVKYMDEYGEYTLDEMPKYSEIGEYTIKFRIFIDDNHTEILDEETLIINNNTIVNNTHDFEGIYDGQEHTIDIDVDLENYDIKYSVNNNDYNLNELPKFKEVGEYTINYKITTDDYDDLIGSNKVKIYGIKQFSDSIIVKNNFLILSNNSFNNLNNNINIYSISKTISHLDNNKNTASSNYIKTGEYINIEINNTKSFEYQLAYIGDVNGDGELSIFDIVKINNHIVDEDKKLENIYALAGDYNEDGNLSIFDIVKINNKIIEETS